ncbi:MAG: DNA polymerase III subunit beta [Actinomycetota bacterium]
MKIQTTKAKLLDSVLFSTRAITSKTTNYILGGVMLEADKNLDIYSTDLETSVKTSIKVKILNKGKIIIPSKIIINILRNFPESKIDLELEPETNQLRITCQNAIFNLNTLPIEEFPQFPEIKKDNSFTIKLNKFKTLIRKTQRSVSEDEGRVVLTGMRCEISKGLIKMISTDSYRLSYMEEDIDLVDKQIGVIIPGKVLDTILKIESGDSDLEINIEENQISFAIVDKNLKTTIVSRLLSGKFPDHTQLVPKNLKHSILINKQNILNVVRRISSIAQDNIPVKFDFLEGKLKVSMDIKEVGSSSEELEIPYGEEEISVAFNPQFLLDGINMIDGEKIILEIDDPLKPILIKSEKEPNLFYLLMPIRVS